MTIFRNSIRNRTAILLSMTEIPHDGHLGRIVQIKNTRVWETQDRIGIVWPGDSSEESRTWLSQIEDDGRTKYRARFTKQEFWAPETEIIKETPWSRIQGTKQREQRNLVKCWQCKANGQCVNGDNCSFRHDMDKRGKSSHSQIRLRILSCGRMSENHREPELPEARVPVVECLDGLARITLEELAITHFVKSGTLQNACSTRPRVVVGLVKSAHTHIVRLMNSRLKGPKRMMIKVQWLCWRKVIGMNEDLSPTNVNHAVGRPVGLVPDQLPLCTGNPVHCDLYPTPGNAPIAIDPLASDLFGLCFRNFRFVIVASLAVSSDFLCPFVSIFGGTSLTKSFVTSCLWITFPLGSTALLASNSLRALQAIFCNSFFLTAFLHLAPWSRPAHRMCSCSLLWSWPQLQRQPAIHGERPILRRHLDHEGLVRRGHCEDREQVLETCLFSFQFRCPTRTTLWHSSSFWVRVLLSWSAGSDLPTRASL